MNRGGIQRIAVELSCNRNCATEALRNCNRMCWMCQPEVVGARNSCTLRDVLILVDQSAESVVSSDVVDHGWGAAGEGS